MIHNLFHRGVLAGTPQLYSAPMVGLAATPTIITDCLVPGCHLANLSRIGEIAQIGLARVNSPSLLLVCNPDIILKPRNSKNTECQDLKLHIQF